MRCLTLKEPWATLVREGKKTIETRTWRTSYRGPILITTSKMPRTGFAGMAIAVVDVLDCRIMTLEDEPAACCAIYPRAQAWLLGNVRPIVPFATQGARGLFVDESVDSRIVFESAV